MRILKRIPVLFGQMLAGVLSLIVLAGVSYGANLMPYLKVVKLNCSCSISPLSAKWDKAPSIVVALNIQSYSVKKVQLKAILTNDRLYIRLKWKDKTKNDKIYGPDQFYDGCALSFPVKHKKGYAPSVCMGQIGGEVDIWHWRANMKDSRAENLVAGGPGTLTRSPDRFLHQKAVWKDGYWYVEFYKPLKDDYSVTLKPGNTYLVSVAVWDGSDRERAMMKAVSNWIRIKVE